MGVGECDLFLAGCEWVLVSVIFFAWVRVTVDECDLSLACCGWVWVNVTFLWLGVGGCG